MFNIIGNIGICLAISDQPVHFINTVVHGFRQQSQAGLGGLDQSVLQIVPEYVITEQADQQAHSQNGTQRENQVCDFVCFLSDKQSFSCIQYNITKEKR